MYVCAHVMWYVYIYIYIYVYVYVYIYVCVHLYIYVSMHEMYACAWRSVGMFVCMQVCNAIMSVCNVCMSWM